MEPKIEYQIVEYKDGSFQAQKRTTVPLERNGKLIGNYNELTMAQFNALGKPEAVSVGAWVDLGNGRRATLEEAKAVIHYEQVKTVHAID